MIIVRIYEGLGNQLFQYAYARALSLSTKQKVFLDVRETGARISEKRLTPRKYSLNHYKITLPICKNVSHFYPYINGSDSTLEIMQLWIWMETGICKDGSRIVDIFKNMNQ